MFVKNISLKPMGFGKLILAPDDIGELPKGFDMKHETVKMFFDKNMLEVADAPVAKPAKAPKPKKVKVETEKALYRMNLAELRDKASSLGLVFDDTYTKSNLTKMIEASDLNEELEAEPTTLE